MKLSSKRGKRAWLMIAAILLVVTTSGFFYIRSAGLPSVKVGLKETKKTKAPITPPKKEAFSKTLYSPTDPASLWVVVNKKNPLNPKTFIPSDLTSVTNVTASNRIAAPLQQMIADAQTAGVQLVAQSGYRSYQTQSNVYGGYVMSDGQAQADTYSARPGFSEHQTGLAVDIGGASQPSCNLQECFGSTVEGKWLSQNSQSYGFIIRYTTQNQLITGYTGEPWHVRFVGLELANELKKQNVSTLEEFFGISGGANY